MSLYMKFKSGIMASSFQGLLAKSKEIYSNWRLSQKLPYQNW